MSKADTATSREVKNFDFQVKEFDDAQGIVRGYLSTFDNVDESGDRVRPGAFKRTLANKYEYKQKHNKRYLMPLLWQHDTDEPIGGFSEAQEDSIGLFVEIEIDLDVQRGREAYSGLKKGYIFQQSMGYDTLQSEYVKVEGQTVRDLIEVRLWEGSIVTFPANARATVTSVKSTPDESEIIPPLSSPEEKSFAANYQEYVATDFWEDWHCLLLSALNRSVCDAFLGPDPLLDMGETLSQFSRAAMAWATSAQAAGLQGYLQEMTTTFNTNYEEMSTHRAPARKAGRTFSSSNAERINAHAQSLHGMADKAMQAIDEHCKTIRAAADDLASLLPGSNDEEAENIEESAKEPPKGGKAVSPASAHGATPHSEASTVDEQELSEVLQQIRSLASSTR